jgi:histidine triad (HIT) family protein
MVKGCPFCMIIAAGDYDSEHSGIVTFPPLHPVAPGHLLAVPVRHVPDALTDTWLTAMTMRWAATTAQLRGLAPCTIMTSVGAEASQSVMHLHVHIVPRKAGDGLMLPWTGQQREAAEARRAQVG